MNLLAGKSFDPATSVSQATTALLGMTALDTANLRLTFSAPPSGIVRVRMTGTLHGATTCPQTLLGVLDGATVRGRMAPMHGATNIAATSLVKAEVDFLVTGLTPGQAYTWDAAYGVETIVAATGLKYGGPNNATANDAFGAFTFEIWDPCPVYSPSSGAAPTTTAHAKLDSVTAKTDQLVFTIANKVDASIQAAADFAQGAADKVWNTTTRTLSAFGFLVTVGTNSDKAGYALSTAGVQAIWDALTSALTTVGSAGKRLVDNLDATVSSRSSHSAADVWASGTRTLTSLGSSLVQEIWDRATSALTVVGSVGKLLVDNVNATISSRSTAATVWTNATRTLSAGTNIVLAKGTGVTGFNDLDAAGVRSAVGLAAASLDTQLTALRADLATLVGRLTAGRAGYLDNLSVGAVAQQATLSTVAAYVDTEVAAIKAVTDALGVVAAARLALSALGIVGGSVVAGATTTSIPTNLTEATDDHYNGALLVFTSGALDGQRTTISDYNGATKTLTVVALTEPPAASDAFVIV